MKVLTSGGRTGRLNRNADPDSNPDLRGKGTSTEHRKFQPWSPVSRGIVDLLFNKLSFREMFDRQERIHENYEGTFQWIYDESHDPSKPWDSFSSWLTEGCGVYWVAGKAGSGKSTLMRMLLQNERTNQLLRQWSQDDPLITASFFFWNSGSKLQMSQEGLLRSVLRQALARRISTASEQFTRKLEAFALTLSPSESWQFKELQQIFRIFIEEDDQPVRYFFLIDGLDEVDGDASRLVYLIHTLGTYPNVKMCVSSRPWNVFEDGFRQQPSLMLQFLTYSDISLYVRENLTGQPAFRELAWGDPEGTAALTNDIADKASGVFLWVVLAVKSLVEGLRDGDRIEDLKARLDEIPAELEALFRKMLHGMTGKHFADAARLLQIYKVSLDPPFNFWAGPPLMILDFAEDSTIKAVAEQSLRPMPGKEWVARSMRMKRRLYSRCNGLLEVEDPRRRVTDNWDAKNIDRLIRRSEAGDATAMATLYRYGRNLGTTTVLYLHRTVKDYLETPEIWSAIESATTGRPLSPAVSMCLAKTMLWKTHEVAPTAGLTGDQAFEDVLSRSIGCILNLTLDSDLDAQIQLLDIVGDALYRESPPAFSARARLSGITFPPEDFLSCAVLNNFGTYVNHKLSQAIPRVSALQRSRLLHVAVSKGLKKARLLYNASDTEYDIRELIGEDPESEEPIFIGPGRIRIEAAPDMNMVKLLLHHGADPLCIIGGLSSRDIVSQRIADTAITDRDYQKFILARILALFDKRCSHKENAKSGSGLAERAKRLLLFK